MCRAWAPRLRCVRRHRPGRRALEASPHFDPTARTASIYWLNYNAPQLSVSSLLSQSVALPDDAQAAAAPLDRFAAGLAVPLPDQILISHEEHSDDLSPQYRSKWHSAPHRRPKCQLMVPS